MSKSKKKEETILTKSLKHSNTDISVEYVKDTGEVKGVFIRQNDSRIYLTGEEFKVFFPFLSDFVEKKEMPAKIVERIIEKSPPSVWPAQPIQYPEITFGDGTTICENTSEEYKKDPSRAMDLSDAKFVTNIKALDKDPKTPAGELFVL